MHLPNNSKQKHSDLQRDRLPHIEKRDRSDTTDALHNNGQPLSVVELYGNIYSGSTIALNIISYVLAQCIIYQNIFEYSCNQVSNQEHYE